MALVGSLFLINCSPQKFTPTANPTLDPSNSTQVEPAPTTTTLPSAQKTEVFTQGPGANQVDILIVDDNSPSMADLEGKLASRFGDFVSSLKDVDYHIGITTTDVSSGPLGLRGSLLPLNGAPGNVLSPTTVNASTVFSNTIRRPEAKCFVFGCASSDEQPLKASLLAMQKAGTVNRSFFRQNADLAIVILTDEDEMSDGPPQATQPQQVISEFESIWGSQKNLGVYGLIVQPGDSACAEQRRAFPEDPLVASQMVANLVEKTKGQTASVCASDYGPALSAISQSVRRRLTTWTLARDPVPGSVAVKMSPQPSIEIPYVIRGDEIVFSSAPAAGTTIQVSYEAKP